MLIHRAFRRGTACLALWAMLAVTVLPSLHQHDGAGIGSGRAQWEQPTGGASDPDGDDCSLCQALHAVGTALPAAFSAQKPPVAALLRPAPPPPEDRSFEHHSGQHPQSRVPPAAT